MTDLRQVHDEVVGVGLLCGGDNIFHGDTRSAIANILGNGGGKQHRFLLHDADQRTQPLDVQPSDVVTVQGHLRWMAKRASDLLQLMDDAIKALSVFCITFIGLQESISLSTS